MFTNFHSNSCVLTGCIIAYSEVQVDPIPTTVWVQANQSASESVSCQAGDTGAAYPATTGIVPMSEETQPPADGEDWVGKSFTDRNIRHAFIKKVQKNFCLIFVDIFIYSAKILLLVASLHHQDAP